MGNGTKGFTKAQVDKSTKLFLIHRVGDLSQKDQVDEAGPAFHKPLLSGPDLLALLGTALLVNAGKWLSEHFCKFVFECGTLLYGFHCVKKDFDLLLL